MNDKPWLSHYPSGVKPAIDLEAFANIPDVFDSTFARFPNHRAFSNMGVALTFREVEVLSRQLAAFFQTGLGLRPGDRLVIQMPNVLQYPVVLFAALRAGLIVINLNPLYSADEMEHHLKDSGAQVVVILENFADKLEKVLARTPVKHVILTEIADLFPQPKRFFVNAAIRYVKKMIPKHGLTGAIRFNEAVHRGRSLTFEKPPIASSDLAFLQYTGGTTGVAKAAMLTHRNIVANMQQTIAWLNNVVPAGGGKLIAALPMYHVFCLTVNCLALFYNGIENVLITNPRDIPDFIKTIAKTRPQGMTAVSTLVSALVNHPDFRAEYVNNMLFTVCGAMPLSSSVAEAWKRFTPSPLIEGYGLTEASPLVACNPLDGHERLGTVGMPVPSTEIQLRDDDGHEVKPGESGELCVRGPQVMKGYWNQPEETAKVLDAQGWLITGDMATLSEDGYLKIVDRKKDMIIVSGFKVYPNEVEDVVMKNPKVLEAAAIGVPDDHSGEAVKIFIVKRDASLTEDEVRTWCHDRLTAYKRPRQVEFRKELPKSNVGKILRRPLRAPAA